MDFMPVMQEFFIQYGYFAVFGALLVCSIGVPIPEDITLVCGGIISGLGYTNVHTMVVVGMAGVLIGDGLMFTIGKKFGTKALKFKPIARVFTEERYQKMQQKFEKYGNWVLFFARFMPGLRTAMFISAGMSQKVSVVRFLMMDGLAAIISVPIWVYLGAAGAKNIHWLEMMIRRFEFGIYGILVFILLGGVGVWYFKKKRKQTSNTKEN